MTNAIPRQQKWYFVRKSKHHAFGTDFEERERFSDEEAGDRFDAVWEGGLREAIAAAPTVPAADALPRIAEVNRRFLKRDAQHREFRFADSVWIAQLSGPRHDLHDQLWSVPRKEYDTRSVTATFGTQELRDAFGRLAGEHGFDPREYARRILTAHLAAVRGKI